MPNIPIKKDSLPDSLLQNRPSPIFQPSSTEHLFTQHQLDVQNPWPIERKHYTGLWPAGILLIGLFFLVFVRVSSAKRFYHIVWGFFSLNQARQLAREDYRLTKPTAIALIALFVMVLSLFLVQLNHYFAFFQPSVSPWWQFVLTCLFVTGIYGLKFIINQILAGLVEDNQSLEEYTYHIFMTNKGIGCFLFPVVIGLHYLEYDIYPMLWTGLIILSVFYCIRAYRGVVIGIGNKRFSYFHLFLYLCTLELFPLAVLLKILLSRL